jgi:hypothetical protein
MRVQLLAEGPQHLRVRWPRRPLETDGAARPQADVVAGGPLHELGRLVERRRHEREQDVLLLAEWSPPSRSTKRTNVSAAASRSGLARHEIWGVHPRAGGAPCG